MNVAQVDSVSTEALVTAMRAPGHAPMLAQLAEQANQNISKLRRLEPSAVKVRALTATTLADEARQRHSEARAAMERTDREEAAADQKLRAVIGAEQAVRTAINRIGEVAEERARRFDEDEPEQAKAVRDALARIRSQVAL